MGAAAGGTAAGPFLWCFLRGSLKFRSVVGFRESRVQLSCLAHLPGLCVFSELLTTPPELSEVWPTFKYTADDTPRK